MIRFIHLSDVHLGAVPDRGCPWSHEREEEIWETFRRVIVGIRKNPVDLLFIAGDLFHRQPLLRELREVDDLFASIPDTRVFLMAGDHDYIKEDSFYRNFVWSRNVTFFDREQQSCVEIADKQIFVYGLSYEHPEIRTPYMMNGNLKISLAFMCCSHMAVKSDIVRWILQDWQQQDLII